MTNDEHLSGGRGEEPGDPVIPASARRGLLVALIAILVAVAAADLLVHHHEHFGIEASFGFHAWYGLLAGAAAILMAGGLGSVLRRRHGYDGE